ncbi:dihydrolipoyl dehydrogenase [Haloarchaeobius sp. HME9146]|uniref:dihydrolipoyl dehydrogenase n=1 Tax=Haloarchaeobius sp. HME9146 TaxID=2978732 RepID=UPI0021C02EC2|nr:dihydrolipoyl dehydrogenase [Haloarchaeobius sp. HME9146]MCT9098068.1 dihydrolipoyl dehydrogenase [Haloarchaeobius sp. HME9146]
MAADSLPTETEVLVIGAGPGGYVAAIRAAQSGLDVTLVEKDAYGGTCLNVGCIPSKALITATDIAHEASEAETMGISADIDVDFGRMTEWKDGVVDRLTGGVEKLCKGNGVTLLDGVASFTGENEVEITSDGTRQGVLAFEHAIVATGSRPIQLPGFSFDGQRILSSTHALALDSLPDQLVVIGAGYIGMELSTVFAKLGVDVTVVEMLDQVLPGYERDVARVVRRRGEKLGIDFRFGEQAASWKPTTTGVRVSTRNEDDERFEYDGDHVVVAVGREPVTDTLNLSAAAIETDDSGFVWTDEQTRTSTANIFAVGDVAGEPMLAHKASKEGEIAAEVVAGTSETIDPRAIPAAVFTDPEIATVGMTEAEAEEAGLEPIVGEMPMRASGRALTLGETDGFVRVVANGTTGTILGAQLVCPDASELVAEFALAVETEATLTEVASTVHTHPTLTEAVMEAAANAHGAAVHTLNR